MTKHKYRRINDADFDDHGLLRDGHKYRAPMRLMDSAPLFPARTMAGHGGPARIIDSRYGDNLHRPGYRQFNFDDEASRVAKQCAYTDYQTALCDAYKNPGFGGDPTITGAGERGTVGQREGDRWTRDGWPGRLARGADGKLFCKPDRRIRTDTASERVCPNCDGSGEVDGEECDTCGGTGYEETAEEIVRNGSRHVELAHPDHRMVDQMMQDHQNKMASIYDELDRELAEAWRRS
jgi:hypothetical protein